MTFSGPIPQLWEEVTCPVVSELMVAHFETKEAGSISESPLG